MKKMLWAALAGGVLAMAPAMASADVGFQYAARPQASSITAGTSTSVDFYLTETVSGGSTSLLQSEGGLYSAGVSISETGVSGGATPALITLLAGNASFGGNRTATIAADSLSATLDENVGTSPSGVASTSGGANEQEIYLGSITIAGAVPGTTTYSLTGLGTTMTNVGTPLDSAGANFAAATGMPFTITVTAVPEPASLGLLAVMGGGLLLRRRGGRR